MRKYYTIVKNFGLNMVITHAYIVGGKLNIAKRYYINGRLANESITISINLLKRGL